MNNSSFFSDSRRTPSNSKFYNGKAFSRRIKVSPELHIGKVGVRVSPRQFTSQPRSRIKFNEHEEKRPSVLTGWIKPDLVQSTKNQQSSRQDQTYSKLKGLISIKGD